MLSQPRVSLSGDYRQCPQQPVRMGVWNAQPAAVGLVRCRHPASPWEGFSAGTIAETSSSLRSTVTTEAALCVGLAPAQLWLSGVGLYGLPRTLSPALSESGRTWWVLGSSPLPYGHTRRQFRMSSQPTSAEKSSFLRVAFPSLDSGGLILNCLPRRWTIFLTQGKQTSHFAFHFSGHPPFASGLRNFPLTCLRWLFLPRCQVLLSHHPLYKGESRLLQPHVSF